MVGWCTSDLFVFYFFTAKGNLGYFHFGAIINKEAINICVQVFVQTRFKLIWKNTKEHDYWIIWWTVINSVIN